MFWPCVICAYIVISLLLGLMFHLAAWFEGPSSPKPVELVVFFLVFSVAGIPLALASLFFSTFAPTAHKPLSSTLQTKEASQN